MQANYTRLYTDENGDSCFEAVFTDMQPLFLVPGIEPLFMGPITPNEGFFWGGASATWNGDARHPAPRRFLAVIMTGMLEITTSTGSTRRFGPGSAYLVEDTTGVGHSARTVGVEAITSLAIALPPFVQNS